MALVSLSLVMVMMTMMVAEGNSKAGKFRVTLQWSTFVKIDLLLKIRAEPGAILIYVGIFTGSHAS